MIITVSGRHTDLSLNARAYAHSKAERLGTFSSRAHRINAVLSQPNAHTHQAELTAFLPGSDPLIVSSQAESVFAAIDLAQDKLARRLRRHQRRLTQRSRAA